jgi:hypothetical protein
MSFVLVGLVLIFGLFAGTFFMVELGRRFGARRMSIDAEGARAGAGAVEGAVFGLMGLMIAFTFSGAAGRFDTRRNQLVDEANSIGTAWLRLDLVSPAAQPSLREKFRQYTDARLAAFRKVPDLSAAKAELDQANSLQSEIWREAVKACGETGTPSATMLLLPALNQMFDAATVRTMGTRVHPPLVIYLVLGVLLLAGALLAGYHMSEGKSRSWVHSLAFVGAIVLAFYVILDFEFPRVGIIRIHGFDQVLIELRQSME